MPDATDRIIAQASWLRSMDIDRARRLLSRAYRRTLLKGEAIFSMADGPGGIFGVVEGVVGFLADDGGNAAVLGHLSGPGHWFGAASMLTGHDRQMACFAQTPCQVVSVASAAIHEMGRADPDLWRDVAILIAQNGAAAQRVARDLMIRDPMMRCLATLYRLSDSVGTDQPLPVGQEQLAVMCNLSRGAVSQVLARLEADGRVRRGYREISLLT